MATCVYSLFQPISSETYGRWILFHYTLLDQYIISVWHLVVMEILEHYFTLDFHTYQFLRTIHVLGTEYYSSHRVCGIAPLGLFSAKLGENFENLLS